MIQANLYSVCPSISWCHLNFCQRLSLCVFDFHIPNLHQVHWGPEHDLWKSSVSVVSSQFRKCSLAGRSNWRGTVIRSMVEATENKETQLNSNLIQGHSRPSDTEFWRQRRMSSRPWQSVWRLTLGSLTLCLFMYAGNTALNIPLLVKNI